MTPDKTETTATNDLFRNELANLLDHRHALYQLADLIDGPVRLFATLSGPGPTTNNRKPEENHITRLFDPSHSSGSESFSDAGKITNLMTNQSIFKRLKNEIHPCSSSPLIPEFILAVHLRACCYKPAQSWLYKLNL